MTSRYAGQYTVMTQRLSRSAPFPAGGPDARTCSMLTMITCAAAAAAATAAAAANETMDDNDSATRRVKRREEWVEFG
jgi:hypothetical protein